MADLKGKGVEELFLTSNRIYPIFSMVLDLVTDIQSSNTYEALIVSVTQKIISDLLYSYSQPLFRQIH